MLKTKRGHHTDFVFAGPETDRSEHCAFPTLLLQTAQ
jgi:hypothetical protein